MKLGIAGTGVIGGALERWLKRSTGHEVWAYDPPQGKTGDLRECDVVFICVPVPTEGRAQNLSIVEEVLKTCTTDKQVIFLRSSVLPGTCDRLAAKHSRTIFAMPEFLTERIADTDMDYQNIVAGSPQHAHSSHYVLLTEIFPGKGINLMSNVEAELSKYMHNGNGTVKVHFNNLVYLFCQMVGADYLRVRQGALMSGYVSKRHTDVPGPDGRLGYGGKCFPKDMEALIGEMSTRGIACESLAHMQIENEAVRGTE
jgi:UDPglucose 6-dehydrogenase